MHFRFFYGRGTNFIDVTRIVIEKFFRGGQVKMVAVNHNSLFGDPLPNVAKVLRIQSPDNSSFMDVAENGSFQVSAEGKISATDFIFLYGANDMFVNVTQVVFENFLDQDFISVSGCYNDYFGDPVPNTRKVLRIQSPNNTTPHVDVAENAFFKMKSRWEDQNFKSIVISYFINTLLSVDYRHMLRAQLTELSRSKILQTGNAVLNVSCTAERHQRTIIETLVKNIVPTANVSFNDSNLYEFPGIFRLWEDSFSQDGATLYFHGKGITHLKKPSADNCRTQMEMRIFNKVINNWANNLWVLRQFDSINKLGMSAGKGGWIWFNYWWAKNSHIRRCEKPIVTDRRHYYEDWICRAAGIDPFHENFIPDDCFSITGKFNIGSTYTAEEASKLVFE